MALEDRKEPGAVPERVAVYTCITNAYDRLPDLPQWPHCDFICFTDNPYLRSDRWEMRYLSGDDLDAARRSRLPKILPHRFLLEYPISVWVDANVTVHTDLAALARLELASRPAAFFTHLERTNVYDEAEMCIKLDKDDPETLRRQADAYRKEGLPAGINDLVTCTVMFRRHRDPKIVSLMELWWKEILRYSRRDQISLPFVAWKLGYALPRTARSATEVFKRGRHYADRRREKKRGAIKNCEIAVLSHPKSGRTWLRTYLANYLRSAGKPADSEFGPGSLDGRGIVFDHEYLEIFQNTAEAPRLIHPRLLSKKRLVVLVRDPRSVCVSYYFHKKLRDRLQVGGLVDFVKSPMFGIERQSAFVNLILDLYDAKKGDKLLLRYEDLVAHPAREFGKFTKFVLPREDASKYASQALDLSSFRRMQKSEIKQSMEPGEDSSQIRFGVKNWDGNLEALKTRKGDPEEARSIFTPSLWNEISSLAETRRLLDRLNYPRC